MEDMAHCGGVTIEGWNRFNVNLWFTCNNSNLQNFIPLSYQFRKYIHPELSLSLIRIWRKMTLLKISCSFSCPCDQLLTTMSPTMLPELPSLLIKQKSRNIEFRQIQWDSMPVVSLLLCNEEAGNISKKHWLDNLLFCESTNVAYCIWKYIILTYRCWHLKKYQISIC